MSKVNILFYEPSSGYGGSSRCLRDWLLHLDLEKFQPAVAVLDNGPVIRQIIEIATEKGFEVHTLEVFRRTSGPVFYPDLLKGYGNFLVYLLKRVLPLALKLKKLIQEKRIALVHVNTSIVTGMEGILAARLARVPCICHLHDTRELGRLERIVSRFVSRFICLTDRAKKIYSKYLGDQRLTRIYNGINVSKKSHRLDIWREFGIPIGSKVVGCIGRITFGKGYEVFLKSAPLILLECPSTYFLIVGAPLVKIEEEYLGKLKSMAGNLGILDHVIFTGWREDALAITASTDVMVQATTTFPEGFGLVCIEAMSQGVPLVVTDVPGPNEIVVHEQTGLIIPPGDHNSMAHAIIRIINDDETAKRFITAGSKRVQDQFNIEHVVDQLEHIYLELAVHNSEK